MVLISRSIDLWKIFKFVSQYVTQYFHHTKYNYL